MNAYLHLLPSMLLVAGSAAAADGDFDPTYGDGGVALFGPGEPNRGMFSPVVQPDGKVLACYTASVSDGDNYQDFGIMRLNAYGSLDTSFGTQGRVTVDFGPSDGCHELALQPDGRIVAAGGTYGWETSDLAIARLEADGSPDTSFGAGTGQTTLAITEVDEAGGLAIQADGKIVIAGATGLGGGGANDFTVVRLLVDGSRDAAFGSNGVLTVNFDSSSAYAYDVAIDATNRIVVVGNAWIGDSGSRFVAARLLPSGNLDPSFDADGKSTIDFGIDANYRSSANALVLDGDGSMSMAGYVEQSGNNWDMAVVRLSPDGSPDAAFGADGKVIVPFDLVSGGFEYATCIVAQGDGKLVIGGTAFDVEAGYGAMARLDVDGSLDGGFGESGRRVFSLVAGNPPNTAIEGLAKQGSRIVGVGAARDDGDEDPYFQFAVRFSIDLVFGNGFE